MTTNVWVVIFDYGYDGIYVERIFDSEDKAKQWCKDDLEEHYKKRNIAEDQKHCNTHLSDAKYFKKELE